MKKYVLAALVIVLVIAGSAFQKSSQNNTKDTLFYWYQVDASGNIVSGSQAFMGVQKDVSYATSHLPCPAGEDADCIRGFTNPITSFPTNAQGDTPPLQKELQ